MISEYVPIIYRIRVDLWKVAYLDTRINNLFCSNFNGRYANCNVNVNCV
jgi:hypothetical protein